MILDTAFSAKTCRGRPHNLALESKCVERVINLACRDDREAKHGILGEGLYRDGQGASTLTVSPESVPRVPHSLRSCALGNVFSNRKPGVG